MIRLLLTASALAAALAVAAGSQGTSAQGATGIDPSWVCKGDSDAGTRLKPHGLMMVADREPGLPCAQGG